MTRRLFRTWAIWLLPLLVAKLFVPVGFMLALDANGLHFVFCPAQGPAPTQVVALASAATDVRHTASAGGESVHSGHAAHAMHADVADLDAVHQVGAGAAGHASHDASGGVYHGEDGTRLDIPCPYALAAVALVLGVPQLVATLTDAGTAPIVARSIFLPGIGPERADQIRGPPAYS
jgi:hypothetical protein